MDSVYVQGGRGVIQASQWKEINHLLWFQEVPQDVVAVLNPVIKGRGHSGALLSEGDGTHEYLLASIQLCEGNGQIMDGRRYLEGSGLWRTQVITPDQEHNHVGVNVWEHSEITLCDLGRSAPSDAVENDVGIQPHLRVNPALVLVWWIENELS